MVIEIPESLISLEPYVKEVWCTFDAFPGRELSARIKEVGREASSVTRTFPVTLIMDQPEDFQILPGMTGSARGRGEPPNQDEEVAIPITAVASADGQSSYVWVIDEASGRVSRREVELGVMTATGIQVSGLDTGLWIATAGVHFLVEGQQVRIMADTSAGGSS